MTKNKMYLYFQSKPSLENVVNHLTNIPHNKISYPIKVNDNSENIRLLTVPYYKVVVFLKQS